VHSSSYTYSLHQGPAAQYVEIKKYWARGLFEIPYARFGGCVVESDSSADEIDSDGDVVITIYNSSSEEGRLSPPHAGVVDEDADAKSADNDEDDDDDDDDDDMSVPRVTPTGNTTLSHPTWALQSAVRTPATCLRVGGVVFWALPGAV